MQFGLFMYRLRNKKSSSESNIYIKKSEKNSLRLRFFSFSLYFFTIKPRPPSHFRVDFFHKWHNCNVYEKNCAEYMNGVKFFEFIHMVASVEKKNQINILKHSQKIDNRESFARNHCQGHECVASAY